jgi:exopolyphosphatase/guanosine-5'-triphosphate,3'-diphosphate pyrophosphatase
VIGLIARYHRQATPKKSHEGYGSLPGALRKTVKVLSSFVRLAEGLDRSHAQMVSDLTVEDRHDDLLLRVKATGDAELEQWAAQRYLAPLEEALQRVVRVEVAHVTPSMIAGTDDDERHAPTPIRKRA